VDVKERSGEEGRGEGNQWIQWIEIAATGF